MDEVLLRQLVRQLKILNFWITTVGLLILAAIVICIVLLIKIVAFVHNTESKITDLQQKTTQSLNVKQQLCTNKSISDFLQNKSTVCQ
jgi:sensor histidine kinase regulating citrate/malate metabolism